MLFSHEITDESFAINLLKFKENLWTPNRAMALNIVSHITWIVSNILGGVTGSLFNFNDTIINFVLTSMFICLLCLQFKGAIYVLCASNIWYYSSVFILSYEQHLIHNYSNLTWCYSLLFYREIYK